MRGGMRRLFFFMIILLFLGTFLIIFISSILDKNEKEHYRLSSPKKVPPQSTNSCKDCKDQREIKKLIERYSKPWKKQEGNYQKFRSQLSNKCHGYDKAIITQANTPVGTKLVYDGEKKRTLQVTTEIFSTFAEGHPFSNKTLHTCAVVGNGGILANSSCGNMIDSAQFVIRCNLPPLSDGYEKHVGNHTDLVTANPSILLEKFGGLMGRRRPFVESLQKYGNSLLLIPAFSYGHNTPVSLRTFYTIEDFGSPTRPVFFNPEYLQSLERFWRSKGLSNVKPHRDNPHLKVNFLSSVSSNNHKENTKKDTDCDFLPWGKQDESQTFRSQLSTTCHGLDKAIITQENTPLESKLVYDGEKGSAIKVTPEIFNTFAKRNPFSNKTLHTCAVVGNGGILFNSSCGKMIDSAQFVIRCNLPPLSNGYEKHVGSKTDLVTANPSILIKKYKSLNKDQQIFVENLQVYGNSLLLLPAFSYRVNTPLSLRAFHATEDFKSPIQTVFLNPEYLKDLDHFWASQGVKAKRLSSGIMMVSLAMELCANVHLYGFWPFSFHPRDRHFLTNHYYDDEKGTGNFHSMSAEFFLMLQLHSQGILRLHLDDCNQ